MNEIYELKQAMMIYQSKNSGCFFQQHDVFPDPNGPDGPPVLGAGRPLTREALEAICRAVLPGMAGNLDFFDGTALASSGTLYGPDLWWIPPKVRPIFFAGQIKMRGGSAPWPALILSAHHNHLSIWAIKGSSRPALDTPLCIAPFFNMTEESICLGNAKHPKRNNDYDGWEKALFKSAFSEERKEQRISGEELLSHFWKELIIAKAKAFPEKRLLPSKKPKTVKELIQQLKGVGQ